MVYLVLCPICKDSKTHDKKPLGLAKCKACNSLFAPKPVEQTSSKQSSNNLQQLNFNLEFSDSENEADSVSEDNVAESFTAKSTVDPKPVKDKRFLLEFSDSEDSDNEVPQETTSFTGTKEKISLGRLPESKGGEETNKQKKREFELSSDSDMDYNEDFLTSINKPKEREFEILSDSEVDDNEAFLTSINKKKKRAFNPLSDSEDGDYEEGFLASKNKQTQREFDSKVDNRKASKNKQEKKKAFMPLSDSEEDFLPRKKKRVFMPLSDSEYEDDGDVLSESEYEDDTESVLEAERIKQRYIALFDTEDHSENEASIHNRHKKTVNDDRDLLSNDVETYQQPLMDDSLFSDADDLIEEEIVKKKKKVSRKRIPSSGEEVEEEVYRKGDLDKKRQKLTAVPKIKLDENGNPIRKKRGKYRFAPRPVNKFNPYILFNKEYRRKFKAANPELDNVGINLLVGKAYRELDPEKKQKLIENSRKLAEQYKNSDGLPEEEKKNTGLNKLPPNGFLLFKQTNREKYVGASNEGMTIDKYLTELWKRLPEPEKETYRVEAKNRKEEFMINHPIMYKELMNRAMSRNLASRRLNSKKRKEA